jgi:hypothetical protein
MEEYRIYTKEQLQSIKKELDNNCVNYSNIIKEQLKDYVWIDHPSTRLSFLISWDYGNLL